MQDHFLYAHMQRVYFSCFSWSSEDGSPIVYGAAAADRGFRWTLLCLQ